MPPKKSALRTASSSTTTTTSTTGASKHAEIGNSSNAEIGDISKDDIKAQPKASALRASSTASTAATLSSPPPAGRDDMVPKRSSDASVADPWESEEAKKLKRRSTSSRGSLTPKQKETRSKASRCICVSIYARAGLRVPLLEEEDREFDTWLSGPGKLPPLKNPKEQLLAAKLEEVLKCADPARTGTFTKADFVRACKESEKNAALFGLAEAQMGFEKQDRALGAILRTNPSKRFTWESFLICYDVQPPKAWGAVDKAKSAAREPGTPADAGAAAASPRGSPRGTPRSDGGASTPRVHRSPSRQPTVPVHEGTLILSGKGVPDEARYFRLFPGRFESYRSALDCFNAMAAGTPGRCTCRVPDIQSIATNDQGFRVTLTHEVLQLRLPDSVNLAESKGPPQHVSFNAETGSITLKTEIEYKKQPVGKVSDDMLVGAFFDEQSSHEVLREVAVLCRLFPGGRLTLSVAARAAAAQAGPPGSLRNTVTGGGSTPRSMARSLSRAESGLPAAASPRQGPDVDAQRLFLAKLRAQLLKSRLQQLGVDADRIEASARLDQKENHVFCLKAQHEHVRFDSGTGRLTLVTPIEFKQRKFGKFRDPPIAQFVEPEGVGQVLAEVAKISFLYFVPVQIKGTDLRFSGNPSNAGQDEWLDSLSWNRVIAIRDALKARGLPDGLLTTAIYDGPLHLVLDLKASPKAEEGAQDRSTTWSRAWRGVVGKPVAAPKSRSRSPRMIGSILFRKPPNSTSAAPAGKQDVKSMSDFVWKPSVEALAEANHPMVQDHLASISYNKPLHVGLVGLSERGQFHERFVLVFSDHVDIYAKPLDVVHQRKPMMRKIRKDITYFQALTHGLIVRLKNTTWSFYIPDDKELLMWKSAFQTMFGALSEMPVDWVLQDCEVMTGPSDEAKPKAPRPPKKLKPKVWESIPERHRHPSPRRAKSRDHSADGRIFAYVNTHPGGRQAGRLLHGAYSTILQGTDMPGGVFTNGGVSGKVPPRDLMSPRLNEDQPLAFEKQTGDRHHFTQHTPRETQVGECPWVKVNQEDIAKLGTRSFTPKTIKGSGPCHKVNDNGGRLWRSQPPLGATSESSAEALSAAG